MSAVPIRLRSRRLRSRWMPRSPFSAASGACGLVVVFLVVYPLFIMVKRLFFGPERSVATSLADAFSQPDLGQVVLNTVILVVGAGVVAIVIGATFAVLNERTDARMGSVSALMPLVPLFIPPVAAAIGWVFLLAPRSGTLNVLLRDALSLVGVHLTEGPVNLYSWPGLIGSLALLEVPFVYLLVSAAARNLDPGLEEAARVSGAGVWRTLVRVTFPSLKPALVSSAFLSVVIGIAFFSLPLIIGGRAGIEVLTVRLARLVRFSANPRLDIAVVYGFLIVVVATLAWWLQGRILARGRFGTIGGKGARPGTLTLGRWRWVARLGMLAYLVTVCILPLLSLVVTSLQPFWSGRINWGAMTLDAYRGMFFEGVRSTRDAVTTSLVLATSGATIGMLLAAVLTFPSRRSRSTAARVAYWATNLPAAIPTLILAVGFILAFAGPPFRLYGTRWIMLLAFVVLYLPFGAAAAASASGQVGKELPEAAHVCGAGPGRTFGRIQLPLTKAGLMSGWALLFVYMVGEFNASALMSTTSNLTVGFVIYDTYENGSYPLLAAVSTVIAVITATVVLGMLVLTRGRASRSPAQR